MFVNNYSHELNLFLYKKDPTFFKAVVLPFLHNKMEKTFIDHYLLQNDAELRQYLDRTSLHDKLNFLEEALLIEWLVGKNELPTARLLADRLRDSLFANKITMQQQQDIFGIITSLKLDVVKEGTLIVLIICRHRWTRRRRPS